MATSFSGGRSRSTQREPLIMGKQLVNFYHLRLRVEFEYLVIALPLKQPSDACKKKIDKNTIFVYFSHFVNFKSSCIKEGPEWLNELGS
jgi:hypothetical protein